MTKHPAKRLLIKFQTLFILFFAFASSAFAENGFLENKGQLRNQHGAANNDVLFLYTGSSLKVQLRKTGYSYEVIRNKNLPQQQAPRTKEGLAGLNLVETHSYRVDIEFKNMYGAAEILPLHPLEGYTNFFLSGETGYSQIKSYKKVIYKNVYPFTDIEFLISDDNKESFKYNIILHPGADINAVKFLISGADAITQDGPAKIELSTPLGSFAETIPESYYAENSELKENVAFDLHNNVLGFSSTYDKTRTLIIDPACNRIWGTFYGGSSVEYCNAAAHDSLDNIYITGYALSTNNIATSGTHQSVLNGGFDIFLTKFSPTGIRLWGTYFGGASPDVAYALYVEKNGNAYVAGATLSTSNIATFNAHQLIFGGGLDDAILAKFDASGLRLWATYYGGTEHEVAQALTVDRNGNAIITGHTESVNNISTAGAYGTTYNFAYDVFIAKINTFGSRVWGTYYGDSDLDEAYGIACDSVGDIYITGGTVSSSGISTPGTHQLNNAGFLDGFVSKFNAAGTSLLWASYYGGPGNDFGTVIEVDKTGRVFVGGTTGSNSGIATPGSHQATQGSVDDAFLVAFNNAGTRLWATYYGGNDVDYINDLLIDHNGDLFFCGSSTSPNAISTPGAYQSTLYSANNYDSYFTKFSPAGQCLYGTYYGSDGNDVARGITRDNSLRLYVAGETTSSNNMAIPGAHQFFPGGTNDAFVARFCFTPEPVISPAGTNTMCAGSITLSTQDWYTTFLWNGTFTGNPLVLTTTVVGTYTYAVYVNDFGCEAASDTVTIQIVKCETGGVDLSEYKNQMSLEMYPNPAKESVHLLIENEPAQKNIRLYSASGALIYESTNSSNTIEIHTGNFSPGLYLLRIESGGYYADKKLVIE